MGHIDADGVPELAVGAPGETIEGITNAGVVHVVPSVTGGGLALSQAVHRDGAAVASPGGLQTNAQFGSAVAIGNFRGGGTRLSDLLVGAPGQDVFQVGGKATSIRNDAGLVAVFEGGSPLLADAPVVDESGAPMSAATVGDAPLAQGRFGEVFAVGDLSGDGVHDLAVSAPGQSVSGVAGGAVFLLLGSKPDNAICVVCGSGGGLQPATAQRLDQGSVGTEGEAGDAFGSSLALRDMDGDGQSDLFIGSRGEDGTAGTDTGLVSIRYGIDVGTFTLRPSHAVVPAGGSQTLELTWTHPGNWRDLESLHVRLASDKDVLFWVRLDVATRRLELVDDGGVRGQATGTPGSQGFLRDRHVALDLRQSQLLTSGPTGRHVTLRLPLRFHPQTPQGTYAVELLATDVHGNSQGFETAGTLQIRQR